MVLEEQCDQISIRQGIKHATRECVNAARKDQEN